MTHNPKKHIIDSLLREIYGEKSPPDQTDEILRRLEARDTSLKSEKRPATAAPQLDLAADHPNASESYPAIRQESAPVTSRSPNWVVIAATLFFCVGLIGALMSVLNQNPAQVAEGNPTPDDNRQADLAVKRSQRLKLQDPNGRDLAVQDSPSDVVDDSDAQPATELAQSPASPDQSAATPGSENNWNVEPQSVNPLPTFAEQAHPLAVGEVISRIDESLMASWQVNVIDSPAPITASQWLQRVHEKLLGRSPAASDLEQWKHYLSGDQLPSTEVQLRIIDSIISDEATAREFTDRWADRFLEYVSHDVPGTGDSSLQRRALQTFLRQAFQQPARLDEIAHQLLAANGSVDPQALNFQAAAGFIALTGNDPNRLAENVSRVFLGTEISCARCHADVVHEQSQADYLGLAAFLQGTHVTSETTGVPVVSETATDRKVPGLFYNSKSGIAVYAAPLIAGHDAELNQEAARASLADQVVRSDRFAKAMVNWVWSEVHGYGLTRDGRISQTYNAPHQLLLAELAEQLVAHDFDFRTLLKWTLLARPFAAGDEPAADTLAKDIPKYGGVPFFSYRYEQLEHDPVESIDRLASAYRQPEGLTTAARLALNVKPTGKGIEIIDQMEQGILPDGLRLQDEVPEFARGWGVESSRTSALDRIADSPTLDLGQKITHLYRLALHREPTSGELAKARSLFASDKPAEEGLYPARSEKEILQDLWWAICPR